VPGTVEIASEHSIASFAAVPGTLSGAPGARVALAAAAVLFIES